MADLDLSWNPSVDLTWDGEEPAEAPAPVEARVKPGDYITSVGRGLKKVPGALTGLADIPFALAGEGRPISTLADKAGEITGFQPGKWAEADAQKFSPEAKQELQDVGDAWSKSGADRLGNAILKNNGDISAAWDQSNFKDVGKAIAENPGATALNVLESIPSMLAGGALSKGLRAVAPAVSPAIAGAAGEGAIAAGQQMDQTDAKVDPQRAAIGALGAGLGDAVLAGVGGKLAGRLGLEDAQTLMAGGRAADKGLGMAAKITGGAISEGVFQELPQSVQEAIWQNWAEKKDLGDGVIRQGVEGMLAGMAIGGPVNALPSPKTDAPPPAPTPDVADVDQANAAIDLPLQQYTDLPGDQKLLTAPPDVIEVPTSTGSTTIDRADGTLSAAVVDTLGEMVQSGMPLRAYANAMDAQAALEARTDADRMRVAPHPRTQGRFAVVPKSAQELAAIDAKAAATQQAEARQAQVSQEEETQKATEATGKKVIELHRAAAQVEKSINDSTPPADAAIAREHAADLRAQAKELQAKLKAEPVPKAPAPTVAAPDMAEAAQAELAPAPVQPITEMPGVQRMQQNRAAAARTQAEARGAQLVDDEVAGANVEPTDAQKQAGNYQKGHTKIGPLDIAIENPAGSTRKGPGWKTKMKAHYGYIKRTLGNDGDQVDVYVKAGTPTDHSGPVFVVDQFDPATGRFDEHKSFVGFGTQAEAQAAYDAHFSDKSGPKRRGAITEMTPAAFKEWAQKGDTSQPIVEKGNPNDEIAQSTGAKFAQKRGESREDYHRRMAAESNARKFGTKAAPAAADTAAADIKEATGSDAAVVQIKDLPDGPADQLSRQAAEFMAKVAKLFGKQVVIVQDLPNADGFYLRGNTIYISTSSSTAHLRVLGHEMLHALKNQAPKAYKAMLAAVQNIATDAQLRAQVRDYFADKKEWSDTQVDAWLATPANKAMITEEWMADLSGNRWAESSFWESVFSKIADQHGSATAKGIIAQLKMAITNALNKLLALVKGDAFGVDERVAEHLDDIREAFATGFADYAKAVKNGQAVDQGPGGAKFARGTANQTLPTRWPTSKALTPSVNDDMITDLATLKQDPKQYDKAVAAILEEPGMHSADIVQGDLDAKAEHIIGRMQSNLLWLYDQVPEAIRNRSKLWYDGAREIADRWSSQYDITQSQAAGALAVLSPQKDWFMNVTMAERVLDILHNKMDHRFDDRMKAAAFSFLVKDAGADEARNTKAYEAVKDKTLAEVAKRHNLRELSVWIRAYDEAYHDAKHAIVTPEGVFVEDKTTVKGDATLRAWGDFTTPGKAASIYLDGSPENINKQLGGEHKVRNFYNNIYAPKDPRFTTIDTHAVAADLLRPLAGADKPVAENFGKTGGTNVTGLSGTYALHYEAYRRAAEARGVLPREMQSITWEAVRGLFTEGFKGKKENLKAVDDIWRQVDDGKLSVADARNQIVEKAGGIENPDWWNEGNAEYQAVLRDKTYVQERNNFVGAKVTFEVAPDPRNAELKARWDALYPNARLDISDKVTWKIAAKALASFNDDNMKGELHHQLGGWMADTNPSLSIWFNKRASGTKINQFARMLGFALRQEAMMRTSPKAFKGMDGQKVKPAGAITIDRKPGDRAEDIYAKVRTVTDKKGKPYIFGHTTDSSHMVLIHQDEAAISTEALHHLIDAALGGDYDVSYTNIYVEFLNQGRNSYGFTGKKADPADASARTRADQLRAEADVLFDQLVGGAKLSTKRSDVASDGRDGAGAARDGQEIRGYGTAAPGAVTVQGIHYSQQERANLDGRYYGTGMRGAEGPRVRAAGDPRLKERVYFYVNKGTGVRPEDGVGAIAHTAQLNNVYDTNADTWLQAKVGRDVAGDAWMNAFESAVIDNGFDGYVTDFGTQRAAVLLGRHNVPVTRGQGGVSEAKQTAPTPVTDRVAADRKLPAGRMTGAEWKQQIPEATMLEDDKGYYKDDVVSQLRQAKLSTKRADDLFARDFATKRTIITREIVVSSKGATEKVKLGNVDSSGKQITNTVQGLEKFWDWYGQGPTDDKGRPVLLYHSTNADISKFEDGRETTNNYGILGDVTTTRSGIFATPNREFSQEYLRSGEGQNVLPIYMALQQPFDIRDGITYEMEKELIDAGVSSRWLYDYRGHDWEMFDNDDEGKNFFVEKLKELGYDGAIINEDNLDREAQVTYVAFNPEQIKSAIGNVGTFDATNPDIRYSTKRFYSQLERQIEAAPDKVFGSAKQVSNWLVANAGKLGIKQDEIQWTGITDWLAMQQKVSKADVLGYLAQNGVKVEEVEKGGKNFDEDNPTEADLPQGWSVVETNGDMDEYGSQARRNAYVVLDENDRPRGYGTRTAEDAIADAYAGYPDLFTSGRNPTQYAQYVLPGGENYRELLLTLPVQDKSPSFEAKRSEALALQQRAYEDGQRDMTTAEAARFAELRDAMADEAKKPKQYFSSVHWNEKNVLAHVRFNDRTDADGNKVLFIEELQSDWGQEGKKKGFGVTGVKKAPSMFQVLDAEGRSVGVFDTREAAEERIRADHGRQVLWAREPLDTTNWVVREQEVVSTESGVPAGPFVTDTKAWLSLGLKRMIAYAVENGYGKVAFVNGQQSADRYSLAKKISRLEWKTNKGESTGVLIGWDINGNGVLEKEMVASAVEDYTGKELADRLINGPVNHETVRGRQVRRIEGADLQVGGEGMKTFYDKIVPQTLSDVLKKVGGGKVETVEVRLKAKVASAQTGFSITPELAAKVEQGLPLFSLKRRINDTIAKVDAVTDGLSNLPNQFDYLKDRYLTLGRIARVDEITSEVRKAFNKATPQDKKASYDYLTTRGATTAGIVDPGLKAVSKRIKDTINYTGDQLVARGLLDQQARDHYKDQYLPRMYLRHLLDDESSKMIGMGKKPSDLGYLKHRKDIPPEIREIVLGEVKDPSFLSVNAIGRAMRDISLMDWMGKISQNNDWVFPEVFAQWKGRKVTAYWLKAEAERIERQAEHYEPTQKATALAMVTQMRSLATTTLGSMSAIDHKIYKQIPDTMRYGLLRGMWVRREIFDDIMGASQIVNADPTWFEDWFQLGGKGSKLTQWWKFTKVALNPPGQIRNFVSNMVMLQLSGIGLHKLPFRLIEAARDIANNGPYWKVAKKYGVTESTFTAQELFRVKRDLIELEAKAGKLNSLRFLMSAGASFLEKVSDLYQFSEALGKTVKIIDEMKKGKSEAEAAIEAQKWLFDYSLVPQSVRLARNAPIGMPFITYQVKVMPRLLEVAAKYPWRFLPWVGLLYGMQAAVASMFGVDDDELKKLKKSLPQWLQDRSHTVFLPIRDADGRLQVADVGYFFPWTFFTQIGNHAAEGNVKKALVDDIGGMFSAPIVGAAAALMSNYDTFTKQPIYKETDPTSYQAAAIANYAYDLMAPPFLSSHGFISPMGLADKKFGGKLVQAEGNVTNRFGDPKATEAQAFAGLLGFNFYGMDPEHTRITNLKTMQYKTLEAEKSLKARLMDRGLTPEERGEYIRDYQAKMLELNQEMMKYAEDSRVPEQLRVKQK